MNDLQKKVWTELYRPQDWNSLIFGNKQLIMNHLKNPMAMPSFIFYSNHPGTGKTTTAKIIAKELDCDTLFINSSDERGVDTVRDKIVVFARNMSSNPDSKRMIFLDEMDSCTKVAQDSLRAIMEEYSSNTFFVMACNDLSKIIEPIQSRCVLINFEKPNKADIQQRIEFICHAEQVKATDKEIVDLVNQCYPDMRSMIKRLQTSKIDGSSIVSNQVSYEDFLNNMKSNNIDYIYNMAYSEEFDVFAFTRWLFRHFFDNISSYDKNVLPEIVLRLAEIEKGWTINANVEIIFIANILQIAKLLQKR